MSRDAVIERLARMCTRWGGALELMPEKDWKAAVAMAVTERRPGFSTFPGVVGGDAHAIDWHTKRILVARDGARIQPIIHEMGHVFATRMPPDAFPRDYDDEFAFFGWEVSVARAAGCFRAWSSGLAEVGYHVGSNRVDAPWGALTSDERDDVIVERLAAAERLRLIDRHDRPLSLR